VSAFIKALKSVEGVRSRFNLSRRRISCSLFAFFVAATALSVSAPSPVPPWRDHQIVVADQKSLLSLPVSRAGPGPKDYVTRSAATKGGKVSPKKLRPHAGRVLGQLGPPGGIDPALVPVCTKR
jgi:hypothetical protein